jgi:prepilin-type N-terminal cleavage/methylation domain-containing protein
MKDLRQQGFTLIELLIALAVSGIIMTGVASVLGQLSNGNAMTTSRQIAVNQVQNAIDQISLDTQMAQNITVADSAGNAKPVDAVSKTVAFNLVASERLVIKWAEWDTTQNTVMFTRGSNGTLTRTNTIKLPGQSASPDTQTLIARFISTISGSWNTNLKVLTINIVATAGQFKPASESRTFQIIPRPAQ